MFAAIVASIVSGAAGKVIGEVLDRGVDLYKAYLNKEISKQQYEAAKEQARLEAQAEIEESWAEASTKIYVAAQETLRASFQAPGWLTRNAWAFVVVSQTLVLLWYQIGLPFYVYFVDIPLIGAGAFPRTGDDLLMWAYAIVGGALGIGAWMMRKQK